MAKRAKAAKGETLALSFRFSEAEKARLDAVAEREGLPGRAAAIRWLLDQDAAQHGRRRKRSTVEQQLSEIRAQLDQVLDLLSE